MIFFVFFFFSSRRRHTRSLCDWSSDVCSSDLITAEGHRVVARDGALAWNPDSGQLVLDFDVASLAERAAPLARRQAAAARRIEDDLDAEQWFDLGLELEVSAPEDARDAYRRALELDPH